MPRVRRRAITSVPTFNRLELWMFGRGVRGFFGNRFRTEDEWRNAYLAHRELLLAQSDAPLNCEPYWWYEPRVPAELRTLPEPGTPDCLVECDRIRAARIAWLEEHSPRC